MRKLIIIAHPNPASLTHALANTYKNLSKKAGHTVEVLDLYTTELRQDFLTYTDPKQIGKDATSQKIQAKITQADELDFFFPIWWSDMPAILKNFFDANFSSGFAFQYVDGRPKGLLAGKTARVFTSCGAPAFFFQIILPLARFWKMGRLGFCGVKTKSFTIFGAVERSEKNREKAMKKLEKLV